METTYKLKNLTFSWGNSESEQARKALVGMVNQLY